MINPPNEFKQVCVWPATVIGKDNITDFEAFMLSEFGTRVKYLEEILTLPDIENGMIVSGTGGRNDAFFSVHNEDVMKFAITRLQMGIRWFEDVVDNGGGKLYADYERLKGYYSWTD